MPVTTKHNVHFYRNSPVIGYCSDIVEYESLMPILDKDSYCMVIVNDQKVMAKPIKISRNKDLITVKLKVNK